MVARDIAFGYFLIPNAADPLLDTAREVERLGLEYVGIQDHPYQRRFVDTFALMSAILARTTTLRVFPDVASLPLRPGPQQRVEHAHDVGDRPNACYRQSALYP